MRTWILERYKVYGRVSLMLAMFMSPVAFHIKNTDPFNLVKITIIWVCGVSAIGFWIAWSAERGRWLPGIHLGIPIVLFLFVSALATVFSQDPTVSLIGLSGRFGGLIPLVLYVTIMIAIVGLYWEVPIDLKEVARAAAGASAVMGAYVLIQAAGLDWNEWREPGGGAPAFPVGTMGNSNFAGGYLGIAVPFLLYVALSAKHEISKVLLIGLVGLDLLALWLTQSRGGMIAAGGGLVTMAFLYRKHLPKWSKVCIAMLMAAAVIVAALVVWHPGSDQPPKALSSVKTLRTGTLSIRLGYWKVAWDIFRDHPTIGTGLETYYANYPKYRSPADGAASGFSIPDKPHNIYLERAANAGILGIGSFLLLFGLTLWWALRRFEKVFGEERLLLASFAGVLGGYLAQGVFSIDVPPLAVMGWVALAGIIVLADPGMLKARESLESGSKRSRQANKNRQGRPNEAALFARDGRTRWPIHVLVAASVIALLVTGLRPVRSGLAVGTALAAQNRGEPLNKVAPHVEKAIGLYPLEPSYFAMLASMYENETLEVSSEAERKSYLKKALDLHTKSFKLSPHTVSLILNVAGVHAHWGQFIDPSGYERADLWWRRALLQDPLNPDIHKIYAEFLSVWSKAVGGKAELQLRQVKELEKATGMRPSGVDAWLDLGEAYKNLNKIDKAWDALERALKLDPDNKEAKDLLATLEPRSP